MTSPPLRRSRTLWLGVFSLAFLVFASIHAGFYRTGARWGPLFADTVGNGITLIVDPSLRDPASGWSHPWGAGPRPDPWKRLGYYRFVEPAHTRYYLVLPYGLLIFLHIGLFTLLVYLRALRHDHYPESAKATKAKDRRTP